MRVLALAAVSLLGIAAAAAVSGEAKAPRAVLPEIKVRTWTKVVRVHGDRLVLVRALEIDGLGGAKPLISCNRCRRYPGPIRKKRTRTSKIFRGLNWLITTKRWILVTVERRGFIGRYVLLSRARNRAVLVFAGAGCLGPRGGRMRCPANTPQPVINTPVTPPTTTTPTPTTPTPTTPTTPAPDTTPPDTTITGGPSGDMQGGSGTFTYTSSEGGTHFECNVDSAGFKTCDGGSLTISFAVGSHTLAVRAIDAAGNTDPTPATRSWTRHPDNGTTFVFDDSSSAFSRNVGSNGDWHTYTGGGSVNNEYWYFENYLACAGDVYRESAQWSASGLPNGAYDVYAYIPSNTPSNSGVAGAALAYGVHYWIQYRDGAVDVRADQSGHGGQWIGLGRFGFNGGGVVKILDDDVQNGTCYRKYLITDAVEFVYRYFG